MTRPKARRRRSENGSKHHSEAASHPTVSGRAGGMPIVDRCAGGLQHGFANGRARKRAASVFWDREFDAPLRLRQTTRHRYVALPPHRPHEVSLLAQRLPSIRCLAAIAPTKCHRHVRPHHCRPAIEPGGAMLAQVAWSGSGLIQPVRISRPRKSGPHAVKVEGSVRTLVSFRSDWPERVASERWDSR